MSLMGRRGGLLERVLKGAVPLAAACGLGGCPAKPVEPVNTVEPINVSNGIIDASAEGSGHVTTEDGENFVLDRAFGENTYDIEFIVGEQWLRRVNSITPLSDGDFYVKTIPTTIAEAAKNGTFQLEKAGNKKSFELCTWEENFDGTKIENPYDILITVNGNAKADLKINVGGEVKNAQIDSLQISVSGDFKIDLETIVKYDANLDEEWSIPIGMPFSYPVVMSVGGLPVYMEVQGDMTLVAKLKAEGYLETGAECISTGHAEFGAKYTRTDGWRGINDKSFTWQHEIKQLCVDGSGGIEVHLVPRLRLEFYKTVGASAGIEPYIGVGASGKKCFGGCQEYDWEIYTGLETPFTVNAEFFAKNLPILEEDLLGGIRKTLAQDSYSYCDDDNDDSDGDSNSGDGGNNGESNLDDTMVNARALVFSSDGVASVSDYLGGTDRVDWYRFTVTDPAAEVWLSSSADAGLDAMMDIVMPNSPEWHWGLGNSGRIDNANGTSHVGTYFIGVNADPGTSGPYNLGIRLSN
jgi:hypothetical protein